MPAQPAEPEAVAILSEMRQKVPIQDDSLHVRVTKVSYLQALCQDSVML